jgi:hypothetical protein
MMNKPNKPRYEICTGDVGRLDALKEVVSQLHGKDAKVKEATQVSVSPPRHQSQLISRAKRNIARKDTVFCRVSAVWQRTEFRRT